MTVHNIAIIFAFFGYCIDTGTTIRIA